MKNLRTYFKYELKRTISELQPDRITGYESQWEFFEALRFLENPAVQETSYEIPSFTLTRIQEIAIRTGMSANISLPGASTSVHNSTPDGSNVIPMLQSNIKMEQPGTYTMLF